jgi:hypothetical protein
MKEKPDWFDLRNYDALKSFELIDWYHRLYHRRWIFGQLPWIGPDDPYFSASLVALQHGVTRDSDFQTGRPITPAVHDLSCEDVAMNARFLDAFMGGERVLFNSFDDIREERYPNHRSGQANIRVDLNATEEQIKKEFASWLKAKKEKMNGRKEVGYKKSTLLNKAKDFDKWIDYKVLQYIDICLYFSAHRLDRCDADVADWLFPSSLGHLDKSVFPTTVRLGRWLMEPSTLRLMEAQLAHIL